MQQNGGRLSKCILVQGFSSVFYRAAATIMNSFLVSFGRVLYVYYSTSLTT